MKKETKRKIGISTNAIVVMALLGMAIWGIMNLDKPADAVDEWTVLKPISENITVSFTIDHTTNATIRVVNDTGRPYIDDAVPRIDADLIFLWYGKPSDTIYVVAHHYWAITPIGVCPTVDADKIFYSSRFQYVYNFYLYADDGIFELASHLGTLKMCSADTVWQDFTHNADQTTYTFHYPKIIGWATP